MPRIYNAPLIPFFVILVVWTQRDIFPHSQCPLGLPAEDKHLHAIQVAGTGVEGVAVLAFKAVRVIR